MEVIGAGLPRTGTLSLKAALEQLGFGPCYHMFEIYDHLDLIDRWLPGVPDGPAGWERVFAGYRSTLDWPASFFWREQAAAFPQAKVILTVRDASRWYASFRTMIRLRAAAMVQDDPTESTRAFQASFARIQPLLARIAHQTFGSTGPIPEWLPGEDQAVAIFERHTAAVRQDLPADRLLVFDVRQGWEPLCAFLGVARPAGGFPRLNDVDALKHRFGRLEAGRP
ncbi:sulfotransferase family protein [Actinomadura craniellae]|uniref:Sulfotransferase family protein n=1 Tax=Actinomadura craniellae TaxID=2231787 RepID=A0A365HCC1_9ACTN|nr:sulfotransferase family protein [Actinomadura craniellae]